MDGRSVVLLTTAGEWEKGTEASDVPGTDVRGENFLRAECTGTQLHAPRKRRKLPRKLLGGQRSARDRGMASGLLPLERRGDISSGAKSTRPTPLDNMRRL